MTKRLHPAVIGFLSVLGAILGTVVLLHYWPWLMVPKNGLPFLLSLWTMLSMWLAGSNPRLGWQFALARQVLWLAYTWFADAWGFLPLNIGLTFVYWRNLYRHRPAVTDRPSKEWYSNQMIKCLSAEKESYRIPLLELVRLKDLKERMRVGPFAQLEDVKDYNENQPKAWADARRALSQNWDNP